MWAFVSARARSRDSAPLGQGGGCPPCTSWLLCLHTLLRRLPISLSYFYYTLYLYFHLFFILPSAPYFTCTGLPIWPSNWCLPLLVADITAITVVTLQIYKISLSSTHLYSAQLSKTASAYKWPSIVSYASLSGHTLDHMLPLTAQAFWDCANFLFT